MLFVVFALLFFLLTGSVFFSVNVTLPPAFSAAAIADALARSTLICKATFNAPLPRSLTLAPPSFFLDQSGITKFLNADRRTSWELAQSFNIDVLIFLSEKYW